MSDAGQGDGLWFEYVTSRSVDGRTAVERACQRVLQRIPEEERGPLLGRRTLVMLVRPDQATARAVDDEKSLEWLVLLDPSLPDFDDFGDMVAVVAHEFAHVVLGHKGRPGSEETRRQRERDADDQVRAWGFDRELSAYRARRGQAAGESAGSEPSP